MKVMYPALFEKEDSRYNVTFPDLPEAITCGDTLEQAIEMAKECLGLCLDVRKENKEEIQWISKIRRHFHLRIEIYNRRKTIKQCKKEVLQTTLQLGKVTYQCVLNQKKSEEIAALSSFIQQRLVTIEELEQQIRQLKQGEEEQDFLDAMF